MTLISFGIVLGAILLLGILAWAGGAWRLRRSSEGAIWTQSATRARASAFGASGEELSVLSWNISYGYGPGSDGLLFRPRARHEALERIDAIAEWLRGSGSHLVLLQEVDFGSARSGGVDQLRRIQEIAGFPYAAQAISWDAGYVPYPYWPPSAHFGRVLSGGAILSRLPILSNHVTLFEKPAENRWVYNLFYLHRYRQAVEIEAWGRRMSVINVHLEAFRPKARESQARELGNAVRSLGSDLLCVAGDFNTVPSWATRKRFVDQNETDYARDATYEIFRRESGLQDAVTEEAYRAREQDFLTYPAPAPDRRLDYCWIPSGIRAKEPRVESSTGALSDHHPFRVVLSDR